MLSVILLSYNSSGRILKVHSDLTRLLRSEQIQFELIIIDDASEDNSYELAAKLEKDIPDVRAFQLSKNYTSFYAMYAGLGVCRGDCAIAIPDDEQLPYHVIIDAYKLWMGGKKIVIPHRIKRDDGLLNDFLANSYYRIINVLTDIKFPKGGADTFLIDREVIDIINSQVQPANTSIVAEVLRLGFDPVFLPFERGRGISSRTRWTYRQRLKLFGDTLFSNSSWPVKVIKTTGVIFVVMPAVIVLLYLINISGNSILIEKIPKWTVGTIIVSFFSGLILYSLGIIAEYVWRIYKEVKNRPGYIIKKKKGEN